MNRLTERQKNRILCLCLLVSAGLIAAGLFLKEPEVVLRKAIRICMECIGLG